MSREIVICHPVRTAIGAFNGSLKDVPATDLGAAAVRETLRRGGVDVSQLASVTMGNVIQAGNGMNPARQAAVNAGVPVEVPAMTVNRVCGSGAQAIVSAAQEIMLGYGNLAVAGGMESMERAPYMLEGGRFGNRMGNAQVIDSLLRDGLDDAFSGKHSGWHTEDLATELSISRDMQDSWAARSQQLFARAQNAGRFDAEIVPLTLEGRKGSITFNRDEHPRPETTVETLSRIKPAFRPDGSITAGNSPGVNSAAAAMIIAEWAYAERRDIEPVARLVSFGIGAVEPGMFGLGPVPAVQMALQRARWTLDQVERYEINEAFSVVPLAVAQQLGLPVDVINVEGGAIAHGHPIGATGAILTTRLIHSMRRDGVRRGVVTMCIGGGQGIALALEAL